MNNLVTQFDRAKSMYDRGLLPLVDICETTETALRLLGATAMEKSLGNTEGRGYSAFEARGKLSRPVVPAIFMNDPKIFSQNWAEVVNSVRPSEYRFTAPARTIDSVIYTAVMAVAACYDLWKTSSRKTPGTFFEVILGSLLGKALPDFGRSKAIALPIPGESVSTDIVFLREEDQNGLVFPAKITTRERIVQPFAHQRILDSVYGNTYKSILLCTSETQRDEKSSKAKMVCVPGTILLYQKHLASLTGIYYLDPPNRYLAPDVASAVPVGTIGLLLTSVLPGLAARKP